MNNWLFQVLPLVASVVFTSQLTRLVCEYMFNYKREASHQPCRPGRKRYSMARGNTVIAAADEIEVEIVC